MEEPTKRGVESRSTQRLIFFIDLNSGLYVTTKMSSVKGRGREREGERKKKREGEGRR